MDSEAEGRISVNIGKWLPDQSEYNVLVGITLATVSGMLARPRRASGMVAYVYIPFTNLCVVMQFDSQIFSLFGCQ